MIRQTASFLLLLSFLFSHIGLTSAKHYCGDFLAAAKVGILAKAPNCGMDMGKASCGDSGKSTENSCCHDDIEHLKAESELLKITSADLQFPAAVFAVPAEVLLQFAALVFPGQSEPVQAFGHSPPHIFSSLRLLAFLQLFLI